MKRKRRLLLLIAAMLAVSTVFLVGCGDKKTKVIPVLMFHHIEEGRQDESCMTPQDFEAKLKLLKEHGYTPISIEEAADFVRSAAPLPKKPVIISFDDGYMSNYEYAFPLLKEYGYKATIFVIGSSVGHYRYYKDTQYELTAHFGEKEIAEMTASGLISIESHSFDMHQWAAYETGDAVRSDMMPLDGESEEAYAAALRHDDALQRELFDSMGLSCLALSYPGGAHTELTDAVLRELGYTAVFTSDETRINKVVVGEPDTLLGLGRMNVTGWTADKDILRYLEMK